VRIDVVLGHALGAKTNACNPFGVLLRRLFLDGEPERLAEVALSKDASAARIPVFWQQVGVFQACPREEPNQALFTPFSELL